MPLGVVVFVKKEDGPEFDVEAELLGSEGLKEDSGLFGPPDDEREFSGDAWPSAAASRSRHSAAVVV